MMDEYIYISFWEKTTPWNSNNSCIMLIYVDSMHDRNVIGETTWRSNSKKTHLQLADASS